MPLMLNRIKLVLIERQKTQVWLSRELGVSQQTVTNWCLNKNQPNLTTLKEIADALKVNTSDLINDRMTNVES